MSQTHIDGPLSEDSLAHLCRQYHKLEVEKVTFAVTLRDSCCILQDARIVIIKNIIEMEEGIYFIVQETRTKAEVYNDGVLSDIVGVYHCSDLSQRLQSVNLNVVQSKSYIMPQWSSVDGEEENVIEDEWTCVILLTPVVITQNLIYTKATIYIYIIYSVQNKNFMDE